MYSSTTSSVRISCHAIGRTSLSMDICTFKASANANNNVNAVLLPVPVIPARYMPFVSTPRTFSRGCVGFCASIVGSPNNHRTSCVYVQRLSTSRRKVGMMSRPKASITLNPSSVLMSIL